MEAKGKILVLIVVLLGFGGSTAQGAIVEIALTGEVTRLDDPGGLLGGQVSLGDTITGSYTYDTDVRNSAPGLEGVGEYRYSSPPYGVSLSIGELTLQTDPHNVDFVIGILNDRNGRDSYAFGSYRNVTSVDGLLVDFISLQFDDYSCTALSSHGLPAVPPTLEAWEQISGLSIDFGDRAAVHLRAQVTSLGYVPEPCTVLLLGLGGVAMVRRRKL